MFPNRAKPRIKKQGQCARLSYDQVFIVKLLTEWTLQGSGDPK